MNSDSWPVTRDWCLGESEKWKADNRLKKKFSLRAQPFGPEPFGNELPSGLSLRVEDKAELLMAEGRALR